MNDKKALLAELQLDPDQREARIPIARLLITGIGAIVLAGFAWFWLIPEPEPLQVKTAVAQSADGKGSARPKNAVLDASGYVTARRQATVSSKFTGKGTGITPTS